MRIAFVLCILFASSAFGQKVWRTVEVSDDCFAAQTKLEEFADIHIRRACEPRYAEGLSVEVDNLFGSDNVRVDLYFPRRKFGLMTIIPTAPTIAYLERAVRSLTQAYGEPDFNQMYRYTTVSRLLGADADGRKTRLLVQWDRSPTVYIMGGQNGAVSTPELYISISISADPDAAQF